LLYFNGTRRHKKVITWVPSRGRDNNTFGAFGVFKVFPRRPYLLRAWGAQNWHRARAITCAVSGEPFRFLIILVCEKIIFWILRNWIARV